MKLFVDFLDKQKLEKELSKYKDLDVSFFISTLPKSQDQLSSINILSLHEPTGYFGTTPWVIQNKHLFQVILTWDDQILNNCENATYLAFGGTWLKPEQYEKPLDKKFEIAHLSGILNKSYGHSMRHEIIARQNEFKIPTNFHRTIGDRHNLEDARKGKEIVFGNSQFGIAIENFSHRGFFTEKLLDCFLMQTIPLYWGCSNIGDYFNINGIIQFNNVDDIINIGNILNEEYYMNRAHIIEENYQTALQYVDYEQNLINKIEEIFKLNNLI